MENRKNPNGPPSEELYRLLPSLNEVLLAPAFSTLLQSYPRTRVIRNARLSLNSIREEVSQGLHTNTSLQKRLALLSANVADGLRRNSRYSLRPVVNATGVLLHTNLGRAPLCRSALDRMVEVGSGYCNLEFDLDSGDRGSRDIHVESLLLALLGEQTEIDTFSDSHRAIVVNNCAAATFLALHAIAKGKEVIVSRGELVEIGGGFRIPEILEESGAFLREVGTTNRTHIADYEQAITSNTGLILRVHRSNFSMDGFVTRPELGELRRMATRAQIPLFEDQGTGLMHSLEPTGLHREVTLRESVRLGCDLVAASGDKLLGGPQGGILVGRKDLIDLILKDPLFRTFRVDKLIYAALEATLMEYLSDTPGAIPIVDMLHLPQQEIRSRCEQIVTRLEAPGLVVEVVSVETVIGGGTAPIAKIPSYAISLRHSSLRASTLLDELRHLDPAIIGRVSEDRVLLDLRSVDAKYDPYLIESLNQQLPTTSMTVEEVGD